MSKVAFLASFLAAFITMDDQFFDGSTTRFVWQNITSASHIAEGQIKFWMRRH